MCTPSRRQQSNLVYLQWQDLCDKEKPFKVFANVAAESKQRLTSLVFASGSAVEISDLRGKEDDFTLDENGFKVFHGHLPDHFDLQSGDCRKSEVVPYLEDLVRKQVKDADLVKCFDWGGCFPIIYVQIYVD